jgi:hypothetical protein
MPLSTLRPPCRVPAGALASEVCPIGSAGERTDDALEDLDRETLMRAMLAGYEEEERTGRKDGAYQRGWHSVVDPALDNIKRNRARKSAKRDDDYIVDLFKRPGGKVAYQRGLEARAAYEAAGASRDVCQAAYEAAIADALIDDDKQLDSDTDDDLDDAFDGVETEPDVPKKDCACERHDDDYDLDGNITVSAARRRAREMLATPGANGRVDRAVTAPVINTDSTDEEAAKAAMIARSRSAWRK